MQANRRHDRGDDEHSRILHQDAERGRDDENAAQHHRIEFLARRQQGSPSNEACGNLDRSCAFARV